MTSNEMWCCASTETFSREGRAIDGPFRVFPKVASKRSGRFCEVTCRRPGRGYRTSFMTLLCKEWNVMSYQKGNKCDSDALFFLSIFVLSFVRTVDTTWWSTRLRTTWVKSASGSSGWRWRGGWVKQPCLLLLEVYLILKAHLGPKP